MAAKDPPTFEKGAVTNAPDGIVRARFVARADEGVEAALTRPPDTRQAAKWQTSPNGRRNLMYFATLAIPLLVLGLSVLAFDLPVVAGLAASALVYAGLFLLLNWRPRLEADRESLQDSIDASLGKSRNLALQLRELEPRLTSLLSDTARVRLRTICQLAQNAASDLASADGTTLQTASRLEHLLSETVDALSLYRQVARRDAPNPDRLEKTSSVIENDLLVVVESALADLSASFGDKENLRLEVVVQVLKNTLAVDGAPRIK